MRPENSPYFPTSDDPAVDSFTPPGQQAERIAVSATKIRTGLTFKSWSAGTPKRIALTLGCTPKAPAIGAIAGARAAIFTLPPSCGGTGWAGVDYAVAHGGYG